MVTLKSICLLKRNLTRSLATTLISIGMQGNSGEPVHVQPSTFLLESCQAGREYRICFCMSLRPGSLPSSGSRLLELTPITRCTVEMVASLALHFSRRSHSRQAVWRRAILWATILRRDYMGSSSRLPFRGDCRSNCWSFISRISSLIRTMLSIPFFSTLASRLSMRPSQGLLPVTRRASCLRGFGVR